MDIDFKEKEIVWAKIKDFPWWPGIIQKISFIKNETENTSEKIYNIDLIGQNFHAKLTKNNIESFINNFQEHIQTNKQNLLSSIELAQKLYERMDNSEKIIEIAENQNEDNNENKETIQKIDSIKKSSQYSDTTTSRDITNFELEATEFENKPTAFLNKKRNEDQKLLFSTISNKTPEIDKNINEDIKININITLTNNNQNTININSYSEENQNENIFNKEIINEIIKKLINYQIQISNNTTQKNIIKELEELKSKLYKENNFDILNLTKSLLPVLNAFTYNRNQEIISKANEILSHITENTIKDIFSMSEEDKKLFDDAINLDEKNLELEICDIINQKNKKAKNKKISENEINDYEGCKNINEDFLFIIKNSDNEKREKKFNELSNDFYKNIYNKEDNGLNYSNGNKRKIFCIKMLNLIKKLMPENNIDFLKKIIIFFEYKIRNEDPTLGKKYCIAIKNLCKKMKEIIDEKEKH